jgi:hypothetical protein
MQNVEILHPGNLNVSYHGAFFFGAERANLALSSTGSTLPARTASVGMSITSARRSLDLVRILVG